MARERRFGSDKSRFAPHEFYQADAVDLRVRFHVDRRDGFFCLLHRRFKTEGPVDEQKIVVDRFRNTDDRHFQTAPLYFACDIERAALRSVAADDKHHADAELFDAVDHVRNAVASASARTEKRTADFMNFVDVVRCQFERFESLIGEKSFKAVLKAEDAAHTVSIV